MKGRIGDIEIEKRFPHLGVADRLMIARPEFESPAEIDTVSARVWEETVATNSSHTDVPKMNILDDFLQNSFPKVTKNKTCNCHSTA